ncbi:DUF4272 domain-containing protein [Pseudomonas sp. SDI]|uniref:DUF4272 domain-containing protein n=1 Tax=Pseudomonas sp. SDI TaxID=2170734 RepID=UPI001403497E|nr:DUF4272 domain-containing protein [Pseudomonas sp. SDI]
MDLQITMGNEMNYFEVRSKSLADSEKLGFPRADILPILDEELVIRPVEEIIDRALVLSVVVAVSYGFPRNKALSWLEKESLTDSLSSLELKFVKSSSQLSQVFQVQVEALCAFAWGLGYLPTLDFSAASPNHLVSVFPDFKVLESARRFREKARLLPVSDMVSALDLAYCLHWGISHARLGGGIVPGKVPPHVIVERHRALEWMFSSVDWDDISLDT